MAQARAASAPETPLFVSNKAKLVILTAVLASLLEIIDTSIVNVAIPTMMGNLGSTLEDISWVVTGYIIANAIVLPIAGWLGMQIGRRVYYIGCILLFTATSVACGLAPNLSTLVLFRVLQGIAGGALLPTSQALIREQFPPDKAGMASAIYGMGVIVGPTIGPTLGGYLTDNFGWRSIFNINLPLGLIAAVMAYGVVDDFKPAPGSAPLLNKDGTPAPASRTPGRVPVDLFGLVLLALAVGSLQFVLERGEADDWFSSPVIIAFSIVAVIAIPMFIWWELRTKHPIVDIRLFKHPAVRTGAGLMLALGAMLYSTIFILPIFVTNILRYTATDTGELFIPGALLTGAMMPFVGRWLKTIDARALIFIGMVVVECFLYMMSGFSSDTTDRDLFWPLIVRGFGMAFLFVPINTVSLGQFSGPALGQVAGLMNLSRQIGGSIGIAALSTLLTQANAKNTVVLGSHLSPLNPAVYQQFQQTKAAFAGGKLQSEVGGAAAEQAAYKSFEGRLAKQVFCISFDELIWLLIIAFGLGLIPLAFMKPSVGGASQEAMDAH